MRAKQLHKQVAIMAAAVCMMVPMHAQAATLSGVDTYGMTAEIQTLMEDSHCMRKLPDTILKIFAEEGGSIHIKSSLFKNDTEAHGMYWADGDKKNQISLSLRTVRDGFPHMMPYYFTHEIGHFIYSNAKMTEEQKAVLQGMHDRFKNYVVGDVSLAETFADEYASFINDGGYNQSPEEQNMFKEVQQAMMDEYYAAHPEEEPEQWEPVIPLWMRNGPDSEVAGN